jgi:hypothetical protein
VFGLKRPLCLLVLVFVLGGVFSQTPPPFSAPGSDLAVRGNYLTIKVALAGPGDELYFWWGHIGLVIEDALSGQSRFYDWGVFSFDTENFYRDFAFGRLFYRCDVSGSEDNIARYVLANRDITLYTLNLPPETKTELLLFAENNVLPENRNYLYHHFRDNCATRVRDIIDRGSGGAFGEAFRAAPGRFTLREQVRRHTWFSPFWDWALSFWMGRDIDRPATVWDEMFLPSEIALRIADFRYTDSGGAERRLVSAVEPLYRAQGRPGVREDPGPSWPVPLAAGLTAALVFALLRAGTTRNGGVSGSGRAGDGQAGGLSRLCRKASGLLQAALGLFWGGAGFLLFFMAFFTTHDYTRHNNNLLLVNPLLLAAVPLGIRYALGQKKSRRADLRRADFCRAESLLKLLWTVVLAGGLAALALNVVPALFQRNAATLVMVMPPAAVLSFLPDRLLRRPLRFSRQGL